MVMQVYIGENLARYGFGEGHPFGPDRMDAFWRDTVKQGLDKRARIATHASCSQEEILRFHTREYVDRVKQQSITGSGYLDYGDTPAFKGVFEATSYVVGSGLNSLVHIMSGDSPRIFVPIAGLKHARRLQHRGDPKAQRAVVLRGHEGPLRVQTGLRRYRRPSW